MPTVPFLRLRSIWLCSLMALAPAGVIATTGELRERAAGAVRKALGQATPGSTESGISLLDAALKGNRLTLNFSREVHELGLGSRGFEAFAHGVDEAASEVLRDQLTTIEFDLRIDGVPLPQLFEKLEHGDAPTVARAARPLMEAGPTTQGIVGRRIAVSPGHGYYLNGTNWGLQRPVLQGIVEDFVNHDIVTHLNSLLMAAGADVRSTRNLDRGAGDGESGFAKWQEAARYHVKALGADASVWNEAGFTHLEQDIRCRPRYANAVEAELLVSIHNNGGGGTGTETLYDTGNAAAAESKRLADILHAKIMAAIRRDYNPNWRDRLVKGFNGSYGENRLATRPAVIIEIAFMGTPTPDNAALQDDRFKQLVAAAVRDGIAEYLGGPLPFAAAGLLAAGETAAVALAWTDAASNETGFRIERKVGSTGAWTLLATVGANVVSYRDTTATAGTSHVYRVQAFNATGAAELYSNEATATTTAAPPALILASVTPSSTLVRDWDEAVEFALTVTDVAGRPVGGAAVTVRDALRNTNATVETDAAGQLTFRSTVPSGQANGSYAYNFQAALAGY
ncbi:MAG: N-acetylmuramoyl-L-alanine amidase, partial [Undibacterium sp.]|nr:N-acetylmuramoyl-L-alanine amidase [Opitutaceae bacterium]